MNGAFFEQNNFWEIEIGHKAERFGNIAHVFSTYEGRMRDENSEKPDLRGINSIQLLHDGTRWWVMSVFWQHENPDHPLPEEYID